MNDRHRLPIGFDPERLAADLARLERVGWIDHFVKQNYQGSWSVIPLRAPAGEEHPVRMIYSDPSCREFVDTPFLAECPYFSEVLGAIDAPIDAVRLMRLSAGSVIKEHTDLELSVEEGTARIHIAIVTNPNVEFYLNRSRIVLEPGSAWYLRLSDPHSVHNNGETARVHMVIDAVVNDWLRDLLVSSARSEVAAVAGGLHA